MLLYFYIVIYFIFISKFFLFSLQCRKVKSKKSFLFFKQHFGEIAKHDVDREIPQLILSYATRLNAEQAVLRGKLFKDKRLQVRC